MNEELFEKICNELETSTDGVNTISKRHGKSWGSFRHYMKENDKAITRYTCARKLQLDFLEELLREIAFNGSNDSEVIEKINIGSNHINRDRLKVDTLKFILSKLRADKYGDKIDVVSDGKKIESISVQIIRPKESE